MALRDLLEKDPKVRKETLSLPTPSGWRQAHDGETERQRVDRVGRSCYSCGQEFAQEGPELDAHEDEH